MSENVSSKGNSPIKFLGLCIGIGLVICIKITSGVTDETIQNESQVYADERSIENTDNEDNKESINQNKTIEVINKHLIDGLLENKGEIFYDAAIKQNVNPKFLNFPILLSSICIHETRTKINGVWIAGTSDVLKENNNIAGINWVKGDGYGHNGRYRVYNNIDDSIYDLASILKRYYIDEGKVTIKQIGKKYAPTSDYQNGKYGMENGVWEVSVSALYNKMIKDVN